MAKGQDTSRGDRGVSAEDHGRRMVSLIERERGGLTGPEFNAVMFAQESGMAESSLLHGSSPWAYTGLGPGGDDRGAGRLGARYSDMPWLYQRSMKG